jgi:hypothetical protein
MDIVVILSEVAVVNPRRKLLAGRSAAVVTWNANLLVKLYIGRCSIKLAGPEACAVSKNLQCPMSP